MSEIQDRINAVRKRSGMEEAYLLALRELDRTVSQLDRYRKALEKIRSNVEYLAAWDIAEDALHEALMERANG